MLEFLGRTAKGLHTTLCIYDSFYALVLVASFTQTPHCYLDTSFSGFSTRDPKTHQLLQVDEAIPVKVLFDKMAYQDVWEDAKVKDCIFYARSSKLLDIPMEWRDSLPQEL